MNEIEINFQLTEKQYLDAIALHNKLQVKRTMVSMVLIAIIIGIYYVVFDLTIIHVLMIVISYVLILWLMKFILKYKHKKIFNTTKLLNNKKMLTFYTDKFSTISDISEVVLKYIALVKWYKNDEFLLIYLHKRAFHIVPIEAFKDVTELQTVLEWFEHYK